MEKFRVFAPPPPCVGLLSRRRGGVRAGVCVTFGVVGFGPRLITHHARENVLF